MRGKVTTPSGIWKLKLPQDLESLILFPLGTVGFPGGSAGKESTCNAGDLGLIPGLGRSPGEGKGYPHQYSCLENSMDCIVHGIAKSQIQLSDFFISWHNGKESTWQCREQGFHSWSPKTFTCHGATQPLYHNCWTLLALEPVLPNQRSHPLAKPSHLIQKAAPSPGQLEKARRQQRRPSASKNNTWISK